jgi:hypothetical protein
MTGREIAMHRALHGRPSQDGLCMQHNREESADSGLGLGSCFNLGSIPEDISAVDSMEMEALDTVATQVTIF